MPAPKVYAPLRVGAKRRRGRDRNAQALSVQHGHLRSRWRAQPQHRHPWQSGEDQDIRWGLDHNEPIEEIANFLCRTHSEVRERIAEIAEADAIGDPSLLRDRMTHRDRVALETYRDARAALALIREAVEACALPGLVTREGYLSPGFTVQAEALVRGIYAIADRCRPKRR